MKIAWATDIHLDHLNSDAEAAFFIRSMSEHSPDAMFLTGDLSMSNFILKHLELIDKNVGCPVYFILGNHDYYYGDIQGTRAKVATFAKGSKHLHYLTDTGSLELTPNTVLMGHDGWYDLLYGFTGAVKFIMSDWSYISDYQGSVNKIGHRHYLSDIQKIVSVSRALAQEAVDFVYQQLSVTSHKNKIVLTHIPPWEQASLYMGKKSEDYALPFFTSKLMGDAILNFANQNSDNKIMVLAGHTHDPFYGYITNNVVCRVGGAQYGKPKYRILEID
jgi:predicted phosphodiesterase